MKLWPSVRRRRALPQESIDTSDQLIQRIRELQSLADGDLGAIAPRRMSDEQLVRAAWGYLGVEEKDLTIEEVEDALRCPA